MRVPKQNNVGANVCRVRDKTAKSTLDAPFVTVAKKNGMPIDVQKTFGSVGKIGRCPITVAAHRPKWNVDKKEAVEVARAVAKKKALDITSGDLICVCTESPGAQRVNICSNG